MSRKQPKVFEEGKAKILTTYNEVNKKGQVEERQVFYNPLQVFNRDLTVAIINQHTQYLKEKRKDHFEGVTILDALSASGLRPIRFMKELEDIKYVYANDLSEASHKLMLENFKLNELDLNKIKMTLKDANQLMYEQKFKLDQERGDYFDVIDLDPYGSAVPFLDAAIQNARTDTLLCITCTDSKVLCGPDVQKCFYSYGSARSKVPAYQENALRVVLYAVASIASKYNKSIIPLFSYMQKEFYCRLFIQIKVQKSDAAKTFSQIGNVFYCEKCHNQHTHTYGKQKNQPNKSEKNEDGTEKKQPQFSMYNMNPLQLPSNNCEMCGNPYQLNGPVWLGDLHNIDFLKKLLAGLEDENCKLELASMKKITGLIKSAIHEKESFSNDQYVPPLGFSPLKLCKIMKITHPGNRKLESGFKSLGYQFVHTFTNAEVFKTNAPGHIIYEILKAFKLESVGKENLLKNLEEDSLGYKLLQRELSVEPNFNLQIAKSDRIAQFIPNPKYQGPKARAVEKKIVGEEQNKIQEEKIEVEQQQEQQQQNEDKDKEGEEITKKIKI